MKTKYQKAIDKNKEITLEQGKVRVEWKYIGEGLSGDYNKDDPKDIPLMRFSVCKKNIKTGVWEQIDDASCCTRIPITIKTPILHKLALIIIDRVYTDILEKQSIKSICEELSRLTEEDT